MRLIGLFAVILGSGCVIDGATDGDSFEVTAADQSADMVFDQMSADGKADGVLGYKAVAQVALNAGLSCDDDRIAVAVAVAKAESGFRANATNVVGNSHGVDRGLWQINSYYHPSVSAACAFSPSCNARAMASISSHGTNFRPWWSYVNDKELPFMPQSLDARDAVCF